MKHKYKVGDIFIGLNTKIIIKELTTYGEDLAYLTNPTEGIWKQWQAFKELLFLEKELDSEFKKIINYPKIWRKINGIQI